jgi:hypothetical protein
MSTVVMPRGSLLWIQFGGAYFKVSEHNRSEFTISPMRIEQTKRMSNGSLRKFHIADKKTFNVAWSMLPAFNTLTVDGGWGAEELRTFYGSSDGRGTFKIKVNLAKNGTDQSASGFEEYTVSITNCTFIAVKRGLQTHWSVSLTMEEV